MIEIQKFEKEIKKGLPEKVYFLYAVDPFFLFEAVRLIGKNFNSLSIETYESPEDINSTSLMTANSLFTEKRILIIHNFEEIKKTEKRIEWLTVASNTLVPPTTLIILSNTSAKDIRDELEFLKKQKISCFNLELNEYDLDKWIIYKASQWALKISPPAIFYLIEITNGKPGLIASEMEKIALISDTSHIELSQIKEILSEVGEYKAFDLVKAVEEKQKEKAFKILEQIRASEADSLLGALNWHFSRNPHTPAKVYSLLYKTNLSLRQARLCSLELLIYELIKD